MLKFKVQAYDDIKKKVFDDVQIFTDYKKAQEYARHRAKAWCEDEKVKLYVLNIGTELFIGDSDFGMLLITLK